MKFSIVTPSYQQAAYLPETMDSVLDQDFPSLEYIVIDGGSKDGSVAIIEERAERLKYWVSEPDEGQTHAICKGFELCTGDVIAWLNSDDLYRPGTLEKVAAVFEAHPEADVVHGACDIIDADGAHLACRRDIDFDYRVATFGVCPLLQPEVFIRRRVMDEVGPPSSALHYLMDREWWLRMAKAGVRFHRIDDVLAALRWHGESKSMAKSEGFGRERDQVISAHWQRFRPRNPALRKIVLTGLRQYYRIIRQWRLFCRDGRPNLIFNKAKQVRNSR